MFYKLPKWLLIVVFVVCAVAGLIVWAAKGFNAIFPPYTHGMRNETVRRISGGK